MAGEAEQVTSIMDEFMDIMPRHQRGRTLFRAHEIQQQRSNHEAEDRPRQQVTNRNRDRRGRQATRRQDRRCVVHGKMHSLISRDPRLTDFGPLGKRFRPLAGGHRACARGENADDEKQ